MKMNENFPSALGCMARLACIGTCLALAACSETETETEPAPSTDVSIGGTVSGLDGTVILQNNGMDDLTLSADGPFTFGLAIASGETYSVTVQTQPADQVCVVNDGSGTAETDVSTVSVVCTSNVTIGGTISGLAGGTVTLENNGGDPLSTDANGPFTFSSTIPNGASYEVTVQTRPVGQTCLVSNGSGTATDDVTDVTVECADLELGLLPEIYATGKAINYSPYRSQGPEEQPPEMPSDEDILEDLTLIDSVGYNLLRLFGADPVSESILRVAQENFPEMVFQQGIFIQRVLPSNCENAVNESQIETGIRLANTFDNVVTVSVGNEPSFAGSAVACLVEYINRTRDAVMQPVTADDDYTFYAGLSVVGPPDTVLPLLDFVSIHMYPITFFREWDWKQEGVEAGPLRAEAMMNAALARAQENYQAVYDYEYQDTSGATVTIGESLPIVIGETGWKWRQTTPTQEIEDYAALPVNAKWYNDLTLTWERSPGGPVTIFPFVAFDEAWKTTDDGWGFWDELRQPNYVLCDTPAGSACNDPLYEGAGYYAP